MSLVTNMDHKKPTNSNVEQLEFSLPINEVKESVEVGQRGSVTIPVEVIGVNAGMISFRKAGKANSQGGFTQASASDMREDLPKAER